MGWECLPCAIVSWKYVTFSLILQEITVKEFARSLCRDSGLRLLNYVETIETLGTLEDDLNKFFMITQP
jgi:hypothetical protein